MISDPICCCICYVRKRYGSSIDSNFDLSAIWNVGFLLVLSSYLSGDASPIF